MCQGLGPKKHDEISEIYRRLRAWRAIRGVFLRLWCAVRDSIARTIVGFKQTITTNNIITRKHRKTIVGFNLLQGSEGLQRESWQATPGLR